MNKKEAFSDFLSDTGKEIFDALREHCKQLKMLDADYFELAMLANSFDVYSRCARTVNVEKSFGDRQIRPEYVAMKTEYQNILKHSGKYGLNPGDRERIFKKMDVKKKKGLEAKMSSAA